MYNQPRIKRLLEPLKIEEFLKMKQHFLSVVFAWEKVAIELKPTPSDSPEELKEFNSTIKRLIEAGFKQDYENPAIFKKVKKQ